MRDPRKTAGATLPERGFRHRGLDVLLLGEILRPPAAPPAVPRRPARRLRGPPTPGRQGGRPITSVEQQRHFRQVIGHFPTGVAVVTANGPDGPSGMTANALCSLSLDPLLLLVCFDESARTLPIVEATGRFAVNVLRHEQHALSGVFASKRAEREKFKGVPYRLRAGVPVLEEALAWLACDLVERHRGGDHVIGIGAVTEMHHHERGEPLVWYRGRYGRVLGGERAEARLPN